MTLGSDSSIISQFRKAVAAASKTMDSKDSKDSKDPPVSGMEILFPIDASH